MPSSLSSLRQSKKEQTFEPDLANGECQASRTSSAQETVPRGFNATKKGSGPGSCCLLERNTNWQERGIRRQAK